MKQEYNEDNQAVLLSSELARPHFPLSAITSTKATSFSSLSSSFFSLCCNLVAAVKIHIFEF
jgi:hypothetical protein